MSRLATKSKPSPYQRVRLHLHGGVALPLGGWGAGGLGGEAAEAVKDSSSSRTALLSAEQSVSTCFSAHYWMTSGKSSFFMRQDCQPGLLEARLEPVAGRPLVVVATGQVDAEVEDQVEP